MCEWLCDPEKSAGKIARESAEKIVTHYTKALISSEAITPHKRPRALQSIRQQCRGPIRFTSTLSGGQARDGNPKSAILGMRPFFGIREFFRSWQAMRPNVASTWPAEARMSCSPCLNQK